MNLAFRISSKAALFKSNNYFIDCTLRSLGNQYMCHRVILAKYSQWFKNFFSENPMPKESETNQRPPIVVDLPLNPENVFKDVLQFIYTGHAKIDIYNIVPLLKVGIYYDIPILVSVARNCVKESTNDVTVLYLCKKLIELELFEEASQLAPIVAKLIVHIFENNVNVELKLSQIYDSVSNGKVFAAIINSEILNYPSKERIEKHKQKIERKKQYIHEHLLETMDFPELPFYIPTDQKVVMIDEYTMHHPTMGIDEKDALASIIDWTTDGAYKYIVQARCDWLPPKTYRKLAVNVLRNRRKNIAVFEKAVAEVSPDKPTSRWFSFAWANQIHESVPVETNPVVDTVSFIGTLGGAAKPFNPVDFGLLQTSYAGRLTTRETQPRCALEGGASYFSAYEFNQEMPAITVEFAGFGVNAQEISASFEVPSLPPGQSLPLALMTASYPRFRRTPASVLLRMFDGRVTNDAKVAIVDQKLDGDICKRKQCLKSLTITLTAQGSRLPILRVRQIEIKGSFPPN